MKSMGLVFHLNFGNRGGDGSSLWTLHEPMSTLAGPHCRLATVDSANICIPDTE